MIEEIIRAGYAGLRTHPPNLEYLDRLLRAYREAGEWKRAAGIRALSFPRRAIL